MVTVFERFSSLNTVKVILVTYTVMREGGTALETLLALNYNLFILTVEIIGVGIYSIKDG